MNSYRFQKKLLIIAAWPIITIFTSEAQAQDELRFSFSGETLTPKQRQIIANVLDPGSELAVLSTARLSPEAPENTFDEINLEDLEKSLQSSRSNSSEDNNSLFIANQEGQSFAVIDRTSDFAARLGIPDLGSGREPQEEDITSAPGVPIFENSPVPSLAASQAWALPLSNTDVMRLGIAISAEAPETVRLPAETVRINRTGLDEIFARLESDLRQLGTTSVRVPADRLSEVEELEIIRAFASSGATFNEATEPMDVAQDLPDGFELLGAEDGQCNVSDTWPMAIEAFHVAMQHNEKVLKLAGIHAPNRARVLIVDSGLSTALAEHETFKRFLKPDITHTLRRGYFWTGQTSKDTRVTCDLGVSGSAGVSPFGIVTSPKHGECSAFEALGGLEPVKTERMPPRYEPDHGGVVGVLAAGGPNLIGSELDLHRYVGIGFARINSIETGKIRARDGDVSKAIQYAMDLDYNVVNMSLAFTYSNSSTAKGKIGCFVNPASSNYCVGRHDRMIVAAAGNDGQLISQSASSFPYEVASSSGHVGSSQVLVVGGIEQDDAGQSVPWRHSTHHRELVDILAPSVGVVSLDGNASPVCMKGTSIAAPQVSFVAGMLFSLGYTKAAEVRERILATAKVSDPDDPLFERSKYGRILDPAAAIDVFSDLIWVLDENGNEVMKRGRLIAQDDDLKGVVLPICSATSSGLRGSGGLRDVSKFALWRKIEGSNAEVWDQKFFADSDRKCLFNPNEKIRFIEHEKGGKIEEFALKGVTRIVPSHFRRALEIHAQQQ